MDDDEWDGDLDILSDPDERAHVFSVLDSFRQFRKAAHHNVTHARRQNFYALPSTHWELLSKPPFSILETFNKIDDAIDANADIADAILQTAVASMGLANAGSAGHSNDDQPVFHGTAKKTDLDKARSTINQLYRDWSLEGKEERSACYGPILRDLRDAFAEGVDRATVKVLIPGAGLGRLVLDVCQEGFDVEGNEISYHQLFTSSFILNHITRANEYALYPWIWSFSNVAKREDQLRKVMVPDIHPASCPPSRGRMNISAGDFCSVYGDEENKESFDVVATVFFIDTAPDLITYIETIKSCLKEGGLWINLGPLLWHFEGRESNHQHNGVAIHSHSEVANPVIDIPESKDERIGDSGSVELSADEVIELVKLYGFEITKDPECLENTRYIGNERSLLQNTYRPYHWIARKCQ